MFGALGSISDQNFYMRMQNVPSLEILIFTFRLKKWQDLFSLHVPMQKPYFYNECAAVRGRICKKGVAEILEIYITFYHSYHICTSMHL